MLFYIAGAEMRRLVARMLTGTAHERIIAGLTIVAWFAMGAFLGSTLEYYFNFSSLSEQSTALFGGVLASGAALALKSV